MFSLPSSPSLLCFGTSGLFYATLRAAFYPYLHAKLEYHELVVK